MFYRLCLCWSRLSYAALAQKEVRCCSPETQGRRCSAAMEDAFSQRSSWSIRLQSKQAHTSLHTVHHNSFKRGINLCTDSALFVLVFFRMVVQCVLKHSTATGDGSKTFIILLASLLRMIHTMACKEPKLSRTYKSRRTAEAATARQLADELLAFALERLEHLIAVGVVPYGCSLSWDNLSTETQIPANSPCVQRLLASFYHSRLSRIHCNFFSNLTYDLLSHCKLKHGQALPSLHFLNDNFAALHTPVSGFPVSYSRLVLGQVIHREFATPCHFSENQHVRAVCFTGYLQPQMLNSGEVLALGRGLPGEEGSIVEFKARAERLLDCLINNLQGLGVSVLLFALKQSPAVHSLAQQAAMCVVECVSEEELSLFTQLSGTRTVPDCQQIEPHHVATLTFCRPIQLGPHRYKKIFFHLKCPDKTFINEVTFYSLDSWFYSR